MQVVCDAVWKMDKDGCNMAWVSCRLLHSSNIWNIVENGQTSDYILGDSGYPCCNWLMTPLLQPHGAAEECYNLSHKRSRVFVEQSVGRWNIIAISDIEFPIINSINFFYVIQYHGLLTTLS